MKKTKKKPSNKQTLTALESKLKEVEKELVKTETRLDRLDEEAQYQRRVMYDLEDIYEKISIQISDIKKRLEK